jgi:hypothetical protein
MDSLGKGAHYNEVLDDGTCFGLFDGTQSAGAISEERFWQYHEEVARREHPAVRGHIFLARDDDWPRSAIQHARVRTALISTYRVHSRRHFAGGERFPESWPSKDIKAPIAERYSPSGTIGYYFGLTIDAALDEAQYYNPEINLTKNQSKILLVHRTHYHDLLYLTPVLSAVWAQLGLPEMHTWDMYLTIMDPRTGNDITDRIGLWAREEGFKGVIYPSARYGQRVDWMDDTKRAVFPALNFVEIGSHLCEQGVAMHMTLNELVRTLTWIAEPPQIVFSEPNLVVFDEEAVAGRDRPVFYTTYELHESAHLKILDDRKGLKTQVKLSYDEKKIVVYVDHPKYTFRAEAPRVVGPEEPVTFSIHRSKTPEGRWVELRNRDQCSALVSRNEQTLGPAHVDTLSSVSEFAAICEISGELPKAQAMFFRAFQSYGRTLGQHDELTKTARRNFLRCNKKLIEMKQRGEVLEESKAMVDAKVNLGDRCWRNATARHLETNLYAVLLPIDPTMSFPQSGLAILIESAQATYVPSDKMNLTTKGELCLLATLQ